MFSVNLCVTDYGTLTALDRENVQIGQRGIRSKWHGLRVSSWLPKKINKKLVKNQPRNSAWINICTDSPRVYCDWLGPPVWPPEQTRSDGTRVSLWGCLIHQIICSGQTNWAPTNRLVWELIKRKPCLPVKKNCSRINSFSNRPQWKGNQRIKASVMVDMRKVLMFSRHAMPWLLDIENGKTFFLCFFVAGFCTLGCARWCGDNARTNEFNTSRPFVTIKSGTGTRWSRSSVGASYSLEFVCVVHIATKKTTTSLVSAIPFQCFHRKIHHARACN